MKIKVIEKSYNDVIKLKSPKHKKPEKQGAFFRWLMKTISKKELSAINFKYEKIGTEKLKPGEPCLFLMNHSSFTDLNIFASVFSDISYHIVSTNDGFIGKEWLMRKLGCIPTKKFISDVNLVKDMKYCLHTLKSSVLMYPEASYSFDGSQTDLPESLGKCLKFLNVPVIMIRTKGAFLRDPLYNNLQKRKNDVSAEIKYLLSPDEIKEKPVEELNAILKKEFTYDYFKEQFESGVEINESFRADGLNRVLYKCSHCMTEGKMNGKGAEIKCEACGKVYKLRTDGKLEAKDGETKFEFVTDWYNWERNCVREEIKNGTYNMTEDVDILVLKDYKAMYKVGDGRLIHTKDGFNLTGCNGELNFNMKSRSAYSLYADYFWYEIGDLIAIGDSKMQYYCFPKNQDSAIVAKARLATEEIYKELTNA